MRFKFETTQMTSQSRRLTFSRSNLHELIAASTEYVWFMILTMLWKSPVCPSFNFFQIFLCDNFWRLFLTELRQHNGKRFDPFPFYRNFEALWVSSTHWTVLIKYYVWLKKLFLDVQKRGNLTKRSLPISDALERSIPCCCAWSRFSEMSMTLHIVF